MSQQSPVNNNNDQGEATSNYQTMADTANGTPTTTEIPSTESHTRSILKGITWRFVATMTTVVIAWLVIGEAGIAFQIGFFEVFAKIMIYYLHERIWAKIPV